MSISLKWTRSVTFAIGNQHSNVLADLFDLLWRALTKVDDVTINSGGLDHQLIIQGDAYLVILSECYADGQELEFAFLNGHGPLLLCVQQRFQFQRRLLQHLPSWKQYRTDGDLQECGSSAELS